MYAIHRWRQQQRTALDAATPEPEPGRPPEASTPDAGAPAAQTPTAPGHRRRGARPAGGAHGSAHPRAHHRPPRVGSPPCSASTASTASTTRSAACRWSSSTRPAGGCGTLDAAMLALPQAGRRPAPAFRSRCTVGAARDGLGGGGGRCGERSWLSTDSDSPAQRMKKSAYTYVRTDLAPVAMNWGGLTDDTLMAPIDRDENIGMAPLAGTTEMHGLTTH